MINEKKLLELEKTLEERRKELEEKIKKLRSPVEYGNDTEGNEDLSEEADETEEFGANLSIAEVLKKELAEVKEDLVRIKKGVYGKYKPGGDGK